MKGQGGRRSGILKSINCLPITSVLIGCLAFLSLRLLPSKARTTTRVRAPVLAYERSLAFLCAIVSFKSILYFTLKRSVGSPKRSFGNLTDSLLQSARLDYRLAIEVVQKSLFLFLSHQ